MPGKRREDELEQTTTGNVGAFAVPLGAGEPLKDVFPSVPDEDPPKPKKSKKRLPGLVREMRRELSKI